MFLLFLTLHLIATAADQISECITASPSFETRWAEKIDPFFETGSRGYFIGQNDIPIVYRVFYSPKASRSVVIFPGFGESTYKYKEVIYQFACMGYSVYIMNHSGMGESGRNLNLPDRETVHINKFSDYVLDAEQFLMIVREHDTNALFLFAHSTGALIGAHLAARHPTWFRATAMDAPLFEANLGHWPRWMAGALATMELGFGRGFHFAPGTADYDPARSTFERNVVTHDETRWRQYSTFYNAHPELWMGGPSVRWVSAILDETTPKKLKTLATQMTIPILAFQAGDDHVVSPGGQKVFCGATSKCSLESFPGAYHEMYRETDNTRATILSHTFEFFERNK